MKVHAFCVITMRCNKGKDVKKCHYLWLSPTTSGKVEVNCKLILDIKIGAANGKLLIREHERM